MVETSLAQLQYTINVSTKFQYKSNKTVGVCDTNLPLFFLYTDGQTKMRVDRGTDRLVPASPKNICFFWWSSTMPTLRQLFKTLKEKVIIYILVTLEHFGLFPQCFQKLSFSWQLKLRIEWY